MLFSPALVKAQNLAESSNWPRLAQDVKFELHFSISESDTENIADKDCRSPSTSGDRICRWSEKIPRIGFAADGWIWQEDEKDLETSVDADSDFAPLSSFVLIYNPNWRIQPFVGIGPTLIISDSGKHKVDSINHIFTGIYYNF